MVNSTCHTCGIRLNDGWHKLVVLKPCNHIYHYTCRHDGICAVCKVPYKEVLSEEMLDANSQDAVNVASVKRSEYRPSFFDYVRCLWRIPLLAYHLVMLYKDYLFGTISYNAVRFRIICVTRILNMNITISGIEKLNPSDPKIYVCNHVCYYDVLVLATFLRAGIMSSKSGLNNPFAPVLAAGYNLLVIDRGQSRNTVSQMNDFVKQKKDSLFLFPQGMFGSYRTLTRFRTGAFATNYEVQPIVLRYRQDVSSMSFLHIACFAGIDVEVRVLDVVRRDPSWSVEEYCERVRLSMAEEGGLRLSDVDSHDVVETRVRASSPTSLNK